MRLEGPCSIDAISRILKRFGGAKYNFVGWVSEVLQLAGECLPNTLVNAGIWVKLVIMACDEAARIVEELKSSAEIPEEPRVLPISTNGTCALHPLGSLIRPRP